MQARKPRLRPHLGSLLLLVSLLAGCKLELPFGNGLSDPLRSETVAFSQYGGARCPQDSPPSADAACAKITLSYPHVTAAGSAEAVQAINRFIMAQILEYGEENGQPLTTPAELAKRFIADYDGVPDNAGGWDLERSMAAVFSNAQLLTLRYLESGYTGGAHPFSGVSYAVLDVNSGRQLTLPELFAPGYETVLNAAAEQAFRQERGLAAQADLEVAGFWFPNNQFKVNTNFGVTEEGLAFHFNAYEVAPYAMGPTEFIVPWDALRPVIPPTSPLASLL